MKAEKAINADEQAAVKAAIGRAEKLTSGEVRVFIEDHSEADPLDRAAFLFKELGMEATSLHNGVLIYVAFADKKFAIIGDKNIHAKVGDNFWDAIKEKMLSHFKVGNIAGGIIEAVDASGNALSKFFPCGDNDKNELSDDVIFGDN